MEVVTGKPIFETITPEEEEDTVFSYPYAFVREAVALMVTVTTIMAMSLFFNAPLEELANPAKTPNPAKAPWYFLGLQELVSHSALLGGVVAPALMVLALIAIPYFDRNPSRRPADRKWILWLFTFFVVANLVLIVVGTFFRGPGWALVPPWVHVVGGASNGTETTATLLRAEPARAGSDRGGSVAGQHAVLEDLSAQVPSAGGAGRTQRRNQGRRSGHAA